MLLYILSLPAWAAPVSLSPDVVIPLPQGIWLTEHQLFTGDLNGDGAPDVMLGATANTGLGPAGTLVYGSDGRRLRPAPAQQLLGFTPVGLIPDADGDGDDELALVDPGTATTLYAPGSPGGLTVPSMVALTAPGTFSDAVVPLWDLDRDGHVDVAINTFTDLGNLGYAIGVGTFSGSPTGLLPSMLTWTINQTYEQLVYADVNGDGYQDALITMMIWGGYFGPERTLQLAWGGPRGLQLPLTPLSVGNLGRGVVSLGDPDGDGDDDVVVIGTAMSLDLSLLEPDPVRGFTLQHIYHNPQLAPATSMVGGDFDGDGLIDLALGDDINNSLTVVTGIDLVSPTTITAQHMAPRGIDELGADLVVADINGDGFDDIVTPRTWRTVPRNELLVFYGR
jgi:hypothetical protein